MCPSEAALPDRATSASRELEKLVRTIILIYAKEYWKGQRATFATVAVTVGNLDWQPFSSA